MLQNSSSRSRYKLRRRLLQIALLRHRACPRGQREVLARLLGLWGLEEGWWGWGGGGGGALWSTVAGKRGRGGEATRHVTIAGANTNLSYGEAVTLIKKTVSDTTRRKSNIVVSGLPERSNPSSSDGTMLSDICYDVLNYNLDGCVVSTKRLGTTTPSSDKPRRLLVVLKSELTVSEMLALARWLRDASDR